MTLDFLPAGGLASSVITTVWVGIMVVVFFNLRFGTTLSGLVVPGYLIPLFLVRPVSAWVILAESAITYFVARLIADRGLVKIGLGEMFGRDRFFMLILISVLVRILSDGFALPMLSEQLTAWGAPYELRSGLHSFGLIIIALCANQLWNGGFKIGSLTLAVYLLTTFVIIKFVLMPLTNFNISTLGYMYEDIASSILASPKAYIILITAAFVASRMNLRYGWDFNGILIPSLLALQWYDPFKILTTFAEAFVIYVGAVLIMRLPLISKMNMEGARLLFLFFNVGFVYKLVLGYAIIWLTPEQKVTDFYGFGYLLGTLIALKMYQKGIVIRFTRTTLQTSLTAIVVASVMGYALTFFSPTISATAANQGSKNSEMLLQTSQDSLAEFVANLRSLSYQSEGAQRPYPLSGLDNSSFKGVFKLASKVDKTTSKGTLNALAVVLQPLGYITTLVDQRYLVFHDGQSHRGWGFYIIDTHASGELAIEVPRALDEPRVAAAADRIYHALGARYLAFSGARSNRSDDSSDDVLLNSQSLFQLFHQASGSNNTLQLRGYTRLSARQLLGVRQDQQALDLQVQQSTLWVKRSLPQDLRLQQLKLLLGDFALNWHNPANQNRQRDTSINGFAEVYLSDSSLLSAYTQTVVQQPYTQVAKQQRIDGYLQSFLLEDKFKIATKHSSAYVPASQYQLLYFDQAVLQPTLALIDALGNDAWDAGYQQQLNQISEAANPFGYETVLYRHIPTGLEYILFKEKLDGNPYHWGTYVLKLRDSSNFIVEVPMPISEQNTYEFGSQLFESLNARAILIVGTHPKANQDGSALLTSSLNRQSLFNLFHQSLLRHDSNNAPFAVQVRGFKPQSNEDAHNVVVAHFENQKPAAQNHPGLAMLKQQLRDNGLVLEQADNQQIHQRFAAKLNAQSRYTRYIQSAQYAEVWLPTQLREQFDRHSEQDLLAKKIAALGLNHHRSDVKQWLQQQSYQPMATAEQAKLISMLQQFHQSENINQLASIQQWLGNQQMTILSDNNSQQLYLAISNPNGEVQLVANLMPINNNIVAGDINRFIDQRQQFFIGDVERETSS
ncbi:MAG: hypothetical protein ACI8WB_001044 [Phenylobacterium sp.]|jgi:hypothetical protein